MDNTADVSCNRGELMHEHHGKRLQEINDHIEKIWPREQRMREHAEMTRSWCEKWLRDNPRR